MSILVSPAISIMLTAAHKKPLEIITDQVDLALLEGSLTPEMFRAVVELYTVFFNFANE